jgi:ABC-type glutathione transport system ATPase component
VSLTLGSGETIGIVGESGSGKSTLARLLVGLQLPDAGSVQYRGQSIYKGNRPYPGAMRRHVQMVFQDPYTSLNPRMKVLAAVAEACRFYDRSSSAEARERALELLASMGITAEDAAKLPRQLSGGQRQRASVARALAATPSVLVADEPTSAIDQSAQAQLLNLLNGLLGRGLSIILISHDLAVVRYLAKRVHVMRDGEFVESGPTLDVFDRPRHPYTEALIASIPGHIARTSATP